MIVKTMRKHRATIRTGLLTATAGLMLGSTPAAAQIDDGIVLNILRECAKIGDATARLACYDNNIRSAGGQPRASAPQQSPAPASSGAPIATAGGFGSETIRTPQRFEAPAPEDASMVAQVASVSQREPGVYQLTLEDGAQWQFAESVDRNYRVPRQGEQIRIDRASLGSFLMRFNNQIGVRIRRVR